MAQVVQPGSFNVPDINGSCSDGYIFPPAFNGPPLQEAVYDNNSCGEVCNANVVPNYMMQAPAHVANRVKRAKRYRTAFTTNQISALESEYQQSRYIDRARRIQLSEMLHLSDRAIKIWYQNRRMKEKKERAAGQDTSVTSSRFTEEWIKNMPVLLYEQLPSIQE